MISSRQRDCLSPLFMGTQTKSGVRCLEKGTRSQNVFFLLPFGMTHGML